MLNLLLLSLAVPIICGLACLLLARISSFVAISVSVIEFIIAILIFLNGKIVYQPLNLKASIFSSGAFLAAALFTLLIAVYSHKFMEKKKRLGEYYCYMLITLGSCAGAFFANDYITFLLYWGILAATLYMLIGISKVESAPAAKKALIMVGGSDALMILGIGLILVLTKSLTIGMYPIILEGWLPALAFLSLCAGAFAKAGAIPLHSWIPDASEVTEMPVMAFLPASLDKLLGIYLLARICMDIFIITPNSSASIFLMFVGSITIMIAVMGALVQHNIRKLLSFHAVSQVGYMVLGIGTGIPVGIAGGLLHMLNNAIYKSCLFLAGGAVEKSTGTSELDKLGGLSKAMPITFACAAIAALSISGVPPFNGFVSKWMIYQGVIELSGTSNLWVIWLVAAMFGSALTLASFVKLIHAVFLGTPSKALKAREVSAFMWVPMVILAALCVILGLFASQTALPYFIYPSIGGVIMIGAWSPLLAALLIVLGIVVGVLIYKFSGIKKLGVRQPYIGGEILDEDLIKVSGTGFYNTVRDWGPLDRIYSSAEKKDFDVFEMSSKLTFWLNGMVSWLHSGSLQTYLAWILLGFLFIAVRMIW